MSPTTACDWCGEPTAAPIPIQMRPHTGIDKQKGTEHG